MGKSFSEKVYDICRKIPKGKVSTYKDVARAVETRGYRAVGNALNKNPYNQVPCHRVIDSKGHLHGFAKGLKKKAEMLRKEGVEVRNNKIDLKRFLYKIR